MLDEYGFEKFEENAYPLAYLLTFRTFGTWLHGDNRGANQRLRRDPHSTRYVEPNVPLRERMAGSMRQGPTILNLVQREYVAAAIREVCRYRRYNLSALNIRSNHGHVVVSGQIKPEKSLTSSKPTRLGNYGRKRSFPRNKLSGAAEPVLAIFGSREMLRLPSSMSYIHKRTSRPKQYLLISVRSREW